MPDPVLALKATAAAAGVSAVVMLLSAFLFRKGRSGLAALAEVLAVGLWAVYVNGHRRARAPQS